MRPIPSTEPVRRGGDAGIGASSAERRQLTVMFCDLVGSTALASRLDPEDLREVLGAYHAAVAEVVAGFGGYVAKYMGDGVLAYFGYPQAHEHDAEQAVRAGLALIDRVGRLKSNATALASRVGIATGLVVVGDLIGSGEAQERGVVGETPNLAARLQEMAPANAVLVAESTRRLVGDLFDYRDLGAVTIKGLAEPVLAAQVLSESTVESRFEALRSATLSPLVGRDEEVQLLLRRWAQAKDGEGQIVLISGEAGIGKSRIAAALQERLEPSGLFGCAISARRTVATAHSFRSLPSLSAPRALHAMTLPRRNSTSWRRCCPSRATALRKQRPYSPTCWRCRPAIAIRRYRTTRDRSASGSSRRLSDSWRIWRSSGLCCSCSRTRTGVIRPRSICWIGSPSASAGCRCSWS